MHDTGPGTTLSQDFYTSVARYTALYRNETVVIKFGGELVADKTALEAIAVQAINLKNLGCNVVLVHGGGKQIDDKMRDAGVEIVKKDGERHTSEKGLAITTECLAGLNADITAVLSAKAREMGAQVSPWGLAGCDGNVITAAPKVAGTLTGSVTHVNEKRLAALMQGDVIPVIYPICAGETAPRMNVNADNVATSVAEALHAKRLIFCSDTPVLDKNRQRIAKIAAAEVQGLIDDGTLRDGMLNKVKACAAAVGRVGGVVILNGKDPLSIERELLSDEGAGTLITAQRAIPAARPAALPKRAL